MSLTGLKIEKLIAKRSARYGINMAILIVITLALLFVINFMAISHNLVVDTTENKKFTLSPYTIQVLEGLKDKVTLISFFETDYPDREKISDLINAYLSKTKKLAAQIIDPDRNPALARKYEVSMYGTTVVERGKKTVQVKGVSEEDLTNAIIKVTQNEEKKIYFLQGHGERNLDGETKADCLHAKKALEASGYLIEELLLVQKGTIPPDCSVLVVNGPQKPLLKREIDLIDQYLAGGNSLLLLIDPLQPFPEIKAFLSRWGVNMGNNIVVDPLSKLFGADISMAVITDYQEAHEITGDFDFPTLFPVARSVIPGEKIKEGLRVTPLAFTNPKSWAETNFKADKPQYDEKEDLKGPFSLATAVSLAKPKNKNMKERSPRMVVVGDSDFASNSFLRFSGNKDMFLNMINWLAQEENLISVRRPKAAKIGTIHINQKEGNAYFYISVVAIPLIVFFSGTFVWFRRRRL